jgi:beta-alanine degradation protein BauB
VRYRLTLMPLIVRRAKAAVMTKWRWSESVMYTLSAFRRRLYSHDSQRDVDMPAGLTGWLPAKQHHGENIGDTATRVIFVEPKADAAGSSPGDVLGPA